MIGIIFMPGCGLAFGSDAASEIRGGSESSGEQGHPEDVAELSGSMTHTAAGPEG